MKEKLLVYGVGSLGEKIYHYNKRDKLFDLVGFIDDKEGIEGSYCGLPLYSFDKVKELYKTEDCVIFVAIGYVKCNYYRELVCKKVKESGYRLTNYISPNAICFESVELGENIILCDNVFVGHGSKIGDGVIIYEGCTFSHDTEIGANCFLSLRVAFGGYTKLGHNSFVGLNATVKDDVVIGDYNIVGCGTNVIRSTEDNNVTVGNPGVSTPKDTISIKI